MKTSSFVTALVLTLALGVGGGSAWAQSANVKIPFKFMADGKEYPAGDYQIKFERSAANQLLLRGLEDNDAANVVNFLTRLSSRDGNKVSVVFDKVGDMNYLSEVYLPGSDGFHLQGAPGKHTHEKVEGVK